MNVSVIVATYGGREWLTRGDTAASDAERLRPAGGIVRLHLPPHLVDGGGSPLARVRNLAAEGALAEWLCFLDGDDALEDGYLEAMRTVFLANPAADSPRPPLLVPAIRYADRPQPVIPNWHRSIYDVNCACIGTLIHADLFRELGGFGDEPIYEDWALWLRAIIAGAKLVPAPGAVYRAGAFGGDGRNVHDPVAATSTYADVRRRHREVPQRVWDAAKVPLTRGG